jgi:ribosomal protein S18 acetylase RimI-like enzyme
VGTKFFDALRYRGERPFDLPSAALLSSIGVSSSGRGRGIGKVLLSAFCERAQYYGASAVYLTANRDNNDAVNRFYELNGFILHSSFLKSRERWMNLYMRPLPDRRRTEQNCLLCKE